MSQDLAFLKGEGDAWFRRNRDALADDRRVDWPLQLLSQLGPQFMPRSAIELGCANGWRLARLVDTIPRLVGIDASAEAIADGCQRYPGIEFHQGLLTKVPVDEAFDLVIVNYVLHWVDRSRLAQAVAEIDRVLADGGILVLGDFLPDYPSRRSYHHLPSADIWTWKQDYAAIFESLGTYKQLVRVAYNHDHPDGLIGACEGRSRGICTVLAKRLRDYYREDT